MKEKPYGLNLYIVPIVVYIKGVFKIIIIIVPLRVLEILSANMRKQWLPLV